MNKRLQVYVEGATEEIFVNRILRNHLSVYGIIVEKPILAATSMQPSGQRGGFVNWPAIEADLKRLFTDDIDENLRFTTLLDTYAIPTTVPGYPGAAQTNIRTAAEVVTIENSWAAHFSEPRFFPYLQRHEFEALTLAYPPALRIVFPQYTKELEILEQAIAGYGNAEDINDGPSTHPSARLARALPAYDALKASNGLFVLLEAGLKNIRPRCPHFDDWLRRWEHWGSE